MATTTPQAKYFYQLGPMADEDLAVEVRAWAMARGVSQSITARELMELGLQRIGETGEWGEGPTEAQYAEARADVTLYGLRQLERRRQNNRDQRADQRAAKRAGATPAT